MLYTNNPIIKHKAGLLNFAQELGNVSRACKVMGVSRDTFYRYQELVIQSNRQWPHTRLTRVLSLLRNKTVNLMSFFSHLIVIFNPYSTRR